MNYCAIAKQLYERSGISTERLPLFNGDVHLADVRPRMLQ
jgi:hypothetical protein